MRTRLCSLLGIEAPIIQASFGPWSNPNIVAAASEAGAIGSVGTALLSAERVRNDVARVRELTDKPFIVNFSLKPFNEEAFAFALEQRVTAISVAHGDPGDLVARAHDAGAVFLHMVNTVQQAEEAARRGVDAIIAQGWEAAGFGGYVSTMSLVPQVVDAVAPIPVVASGGIADGRGLAAAIVLGAEGVNIGTRFLAAEEAGVSSAWQDRLVSAGSEDTVKIDFIDSIVPPGPHVYHTVPRALRTDFIDRYNVDPAAAREGSARLSQEVMTALREGRGEEYIPFTGQSVGLIGEILPAKAIVEEIVASAEKILAQGPRAHS